jgi:CHASE2 domain-containing sensor protein
MLSGYDHGTLSELSNRKYTPRRTREQRAFRLVQVGAVSGGIAVVGFVLALIGVIGWFIPFIAAVVAVVCVVLFRSVVGRR